MLKFLKNCEKYEYAAQDGAHLAISLFATALGAILIAIEGIVLTVIALKIFTVLGVFGW